MPRSDNSCQIRIIETRCRASRRGNSILKKRIVLGKASVPIHRPRSHPDMRPGKIKSSARHGRLQILQQFRSRACASKRGCEDCAHNEHDRSHTLANRINGVSHTVLHVTIPLLNIGLSYNRCSRQARTTPQKPKLEPTVSHARKL